MARIARGVGSHFERRLHEWCLAGWLLTIGVRLVMPGDTFHSTPTYRILRRIVSEGAWGYSAIAIGTLWLIALTLNGTFRRFRIISPWFRGGCALACACYCALTAITSLQSNPLGPNGIDNIAFSGLAVASALIISREVGRNS